MSKYQHALRCGFYLSACTDSFSPAPAVICITQYFPAVIQKFFFIIAVFSCIVNYFYLAPECFFPKFFPDFHYLAHYLAHFFAYFLLRLHKYGSKNGKQIYFSINQVSSLSAFICISYSSLFVLAAIMRMPNPQAIFS